MLLLYYKPKQLNLDFWKKPYPILYYNDNYCNIYKLYMIKWTFLRWNSSFTFKKIKEEIERERSLNFKMKKIIFFF